MVVSELLTCAQSIQSTRATREKISEDCSRPVDACISQGEVLTLYQRTPNAMFSQPCEVTILTFVAYGLQRLEAAWCAQMVNCWRDVCTESRWLRSQTYFADKHHTYQKFMKAFNALREGSRTKWKNQLAAAKFHKEVLEKKTLRGLFKAQQSRKQQHKQLYLAKAFKAVKHYHEKKKLLRCMYNGAQIFHGTSLKRHALNCLSNHHQRVKLESSREATASCHWKKFTRSNVLKRWGTIACRIAKAKKQIDESRTVFLKGLQKRCMENWYLVTNERKRAIQSKFVQAYQEVKKSRQKRTLKVWSQWHREKQLRRLKSEQIATMHSGRTSAAVTKAWQDYAREKGKGRAKSSIAFSFRRKQVLLDAIAVWKAYQAKKERAGAAALKALVHLKQNLAQKSMDSWKPWHEKQMSKKKGREEALNIYKSVSKSIILHALICSTIYEIPDSRNTNKCLVNITSNWSVSETIFLFSQIPATEMGV